MACPEVEPRIGVELAQGNAYKSPRGVLVFFTGGTGASWWSAGDSKVQKLGETFRVLGFDVIQVKWDQPGWLISSPGDDAGIAHLACRPATVIQYVYEHEYIPLGLTKIPGRAGFAISGNSGGASQVSYALSHYGLSDIVDVAVPSGGPPHAVLAKSCMDKPAQKSFWYALGIRQFIDEGFGYFNGQGPCAVHNSFFIPEWRRESCATGGNDYYYPSTRVHFLVGEQDLQMQHVGKQYFLKLLHSKSPYISWQLIPDTPHQITATRAGRKALKNAILGISH